MKTISMDLYQNAGEEVSGAELHEILREIDTNMNGQVELDEYLQVYSFLRTIYLFFNLIFLKIVKIFKFCKN